MTRILEEQNGQCVLSGDTFTIKDAIKTLGGRWNGAQKKWIVPSSAANIASLKELGFVVITKDTVDVAPLPPNTLSVKEFVGIIEGVVVKSLSGSWWISGEISGYRLSHGHHYFDMVENESETQGPARAAAISCALWKGKAAALAPAMQELTLADGLKVRIQVHCDFRRETSRITAIVDDIDPAFTLGDLALTRQKIVQELKKRGLYERNRQTQLHPLPLRIALITSQDSRAASDFCDELSQSGIAFTITLFDSHTQGESTSREVSGAFAHIRERDEFDCVVLTRGGGSRMDLRWFDDMEICKAIAYCSVPVISAIGHFEDISIADELAFRAEKTPTAAARFLSGFALSTIADLNARVEALGRRIFERIATEQQRLARAEQSIMGWAKQRLEQEMRALAGYEQSLRLVKAAHERTLDRGFALIKNNEGKTLSAKAFLGRDTPKELAIEMHSEQKIIKVYAVVQNIEISDK